MPKTVRDMLELDSFEGAKVVAGAQGLSHVVQGASLMEVPTCSPIWSRGRCF